MKKFLPFLTALCLLFGSVWTMQGQAPQIVSLNPDSNATEVPLDVELQLEFDVDIIFNSSDLPKSIQVIETGTSTTVVDGFTYKGNAYDGPIDKNADTLFIDLSALSSPLSPETQYSVIIEEGAIESAANSTDFAGIDDINTRWRFTTVSRPGLSSKSPLNDATGVTGLDTLTLTFDETINLGTNKNLYIYKDGGTLFQTINTTDDAGLITVSGSDYDVNISHDAFNGDQNFYIDVEEGFVTSQSTGVGSAAIDGTTEWSFTSASGPGLAGFSPANPPEPNVHADEPLIIEYNEPVTLSEDKNVIIYYDDGTVFQTINTTTDAALFSYNSTDNELTISHDNFPGSTTFNIVVEEGLVTADDNNIASEVIDETNLDWTFTTASAPYISSFAPDGETNVEGNRVLELNFSENIALGDNKNLYIHRAGDDQLFQTINTGTDAGLFAITDTSLQISHDPLWGNTSFYVLADEGLAVSASTAIAAEGISSTTRWTFTTTGGPVVETYTPEAASTGASISAPLEINFNEDISIGTSGSITIYLTADSSVVESVSYDSGQLSASNDTLIINHSELMPETEYFINVDTGLVLSSSTGTPWEGINDASWSFTTAGAPQVSGYYPLQDEANAPVDQSLILTFTENIKTGSSGYIKIREEGNTYFQDIPFDAGLLSINNNELHVSHDDFNPGTTYFVRIDSNVVRSLVTNVPFPGISDTTQWRFTTAGPPTVSSLSPANGSEVSTAAENLIITFSEIIEAGTSGSFRIKYANSGGVSFQSVSIDETEYIDITDSILTISHLDFTPDTGYYITIDPGFVKSAVSGVDFGGIQDTTEWTFTAPSGPQITTYEPGNNSIDIPVDSVLTLTFDENIARGSGNMIIHHPGGSDAVTISASSSSNLTIDGNRLSFPNITMPYDETLYVTIDEGFVKSESSGFNFSGITDTTEWAFTTLPSPPEFSSGYPYFHSITPDNIDLAVMTNNDAHYYFVVTSSSTPPSNTQIMNGQKSDGNPAPASGNGSLQANNDTIHQNIDISSLSEGYHWLHAIAKHPDKDIFSETASIEIDKVPPITTIEPADGTTNFPEDGNMTISFNESVYSSGTAIDNTNVSDFVLLKQGEDTVVCSVSINTSTNVITINPDTNLSPLTEYTVTMEAVEDQIGNIQSGSTTSTFTTDKINTWSGGGADPGDWSDPDNWSSGSFTENTSIFVPSSANPLIADSSVTVYNIDLEAGAVMQHSADTITVNGEFRLRSSADKNASYLNTGGILIVNADSVKIEQVITADTINYNISPPTSGATKATMGVTDQMFAYNNSTGLYEEVGENTSLNPGTGYILRSDAGNIIFSGDINLSEIVVDLGWSSTALGWNLVGNPFTGSLDWTTISRTNVEDAFWIWQNRDEVYGVYNYELGTGVNIDSPIIPSNQAFWVKVPTATKDDPASISFSTSNLQANTTSYLKSTSTPELLKIAGSNGMVKDETAVVINEDASDNLDRLDSDKMLSKASDALELFSPLEDKQIAINAIPAFTETKEIPIGYYAGKSGEYQIELVNQTMTNLESVILIDHDRNTEWTLSPENPYHFTVDSVGSNDTRFTLKMVTQTVPTNINNQDEKKNQCTVYAQNKHIMIKTPDNNNLRYHLTDMSGRTLDNGNLEPQSLNRIPAPGTGIYIVTIASDKGKEEHKVAIE
jgi:hypothetical protein